MVYLESAYPVHRCLFMGGSLQAVLAKGCDVAVPG